MVNIDLLGSGVIAFGGHYEFWWLLRFEAGVIAFGSRGWLGSFHHAKDVWLKGVTSNGTKNTGETGAAFACPGFGRGVRSRGSQGMSRRSVSDVLDAARAVGVGWDDVAGKTDGRGCTPCCFPVGVSAKACTSSRLGQGSSRAGARGRDVEDPARRIRGRMPTDRETPYGLRPVLQAVRRIRAEVGRDEAGWSTRPAAPSRSTGPARLADRGSGHRGFVNGVSVRGRAAVQPVRVRGTHARHGAELVAAGPCGDVRVVRRFPRPAWCATI